MIDENLIAPFAACTCQRAVEIGDPYEEWWDALPEIRKGCPVLRELMLPDEIWQKYQERIRFLGKGVSENNPGCHGSVIHTALERGKLGKLMAPIHSFLFDGESLKSAVKVQYRKDLRETWLFEDDVLEKHRKFRILWGIVNELLLAWSMRRRGLVVESLEALGGPEDISLRVSGHEWAIQSKYIGQPDEEFEHVLSSLHDRPKGMWGDIPGAFAYLQFRAAEASAQFKPVEKRRIACLTICGMSLFTDDVIEDEYFTEWEHFVKVENREKMQELLDLVQDPKKPPKWTIDRVESVLQNLDEIWFCMEERDYDLTIPCSIVKPGRPDGSEHRSGCLGLSHRRSQ